MSQEVILDLTEELTTDKTLLIGLEEAGDVGVYMRGRNDTLVKRTKDDREWEEWRV